MYQCCIQCTNFKRVNFFRRSVSFSSGESETENSSTYKNESSSFGIRPQFGKAISPNKVLGLFLNYGNSKYKQTSGTGTSNTDEKNKFYGGGVFLRNYYPLSSRFYLFGDGSLGVNFSDRERKNNLILSSEEKTTAVGLGITPGISFAAGRKLHLEISLNNLLSLDYSYSKSKIYNNNGTLNSSSKGHSFSAAANANGFSQISIGLRWILPSSK
ncbi:MAG: hypothetical protein EOO10_12355 [Chitinophagaceae bacterium]|nr:MAG: hypothetical protein EOO10_12355 [Chitinophagaceae bacterium]